MANVPDVSQETLEHLKENVRFPAPFKHVRDFSYIPKSLLEKEVIPDIVMLETHDHDEEVDKTKVKMNQQQQLKTDQANEVQSSKVQSPEQNYTAHTGGSVIVPYLHGSVFHGPVSINITGGGGSKQLTGKTALASSKSEDYSNLPRGIRGDIKKELQKELGAKFQKVYEGSMLEGYNVLLRNIYTDLNVIEGCTGGVNTEHEVRQVESFNSKTEKTRIAFSDVFKRQSDPTTHGTKVLTVGIAGVGKTVCVHKFILDWAEDQCNQDLDFILFIPFRHLNLIKDEQYSLWDLLLYFHREFLNGDVMKILHKNCRMLFILDGLDESRILLNFNQKKVSNVTEKTTLDKLITSLIKGELLPSALVWITSRPAAASQIPRKHFSCVTEIHGFNDSQKEEYFRKRIQDEDQANRIISHIKTNRSLHILCHIPVFCRISATVLQEMFKNDQEMTNAPTNLTEMYTRFLLFLTKRKSEKFCSLNEKDTVAKSETARVDAEGILKLGKLAFIQLQKGKLLFYENDLRECGIGVEEALVYSGVCTQIFKMDEKIFSFVHLTFQEFLAAVYVFLTFSHESNPLLQTMLEKIKWKFKHTLLDLLKIAVNKAIKNDEGHLDLFLRFLLGLSLESNQKLLKTLQPEMVFKEGSLQYTLDYIKKKIRKASSSEKTTNLFHCLSELQDSSLSSEVLNYLNSGALTTQVLSSTQWSALIFVLLMSEDAQEKFELKKCRPSDEGVWRLLPVIKSTRRALLSHCNLTMESCKMLASVLQSSDSPLKELDLSTNDLQDSGVELLSAGLKSSHCKLETLRLSGCMITGDSCSCLAAALSSNPSHLKELDLTYNHPGESGVKLLSARLEDPHCSLSTLRVDHGGRVRLKPGLKKYACMLTLDPNTAHVFLTLSEGNRKVTCMRKRQPYHEHPERFIDSPQVMCRHSLTGCCYWEAEWSGKVSIAATYKDISRSGDRNDCIFGYNQSSWSLHCSNNSYSVWHNKTETALPVLTHSNRVGVYLDWPAGTLSFYSVSSDHGLTHLHTFQTEFSAPIHAGFTVPVYDSSVSLCLIEES